MALHSQNSSDEVFETAVAVLEEGFASLDELRRANAYRNSRRPQIGKLAMTLGKLTIAQVFDILCQQAETGDLFGETALQMGYIDQYDLHDIMLKQTELTPTLLDALVALAVISPDQGKQILWKTLRRVQGAPSPDGVQAVDA